MRKLNLRINDFHSVIYPMVNMVIIMFRLQNLNMFVILNSLCRPKVINDLNCDSRI